MPNFIGIEPSFPKLWIRLYFLCSGALIKSVLRCFLVDNSRRWDSSIIVSKHEVIIEIPRWLTELNVFLGGFTTELFMCPWRFGVHCGIDIISVSLGSSREAMLDSISLPEIILIKGTLGGLWIKFTGYSRIHIICRCSSSRINYDIVEHRLDC